MKAKIKRGKGFRGVLDYALSKDEPRLVGGNMSGMSARDLAKEFAAARMLRPDIEKPVWHSSLSAAPGERLTDDKWGEVAARYMKGMGFSESTQYVVIRHTPVQDQLNPPEPTFTNTGKRRKAGPECEHVHIVASRVNLEGKVWLGQRDVHLAIEQTQQLEREFGLVETKGFDGPKDIAALTRGEAGMAARTGEMAPREYLQHTLAAIVASNPTMGEFIEKAQAAGIGLRANVASTGRMNGFSFERDCMTFSGQQLGASFKWGALQKQIDYQQERDTALLQQLEASAKAATPHAAPAVPPDALHLWSTGHKGFRPAPSKRLPFLWPRSKKKHGMNLTKAQEEQLKVMVERLAHMLTKLVCRAFGVDYQTPHEKEQLERQRRRAARMADLPKDKAHEAPKPTEHQHDHAERREAARNVQEAMAHQRAERLEAQRRAAEQKAEADRRAQERLRDEEIHDDREADRRHDDREHEERHDEAKRAIAKKGLSRSSALESLAERGDVRGIERMLEEGAHVKGKALDAAAKGGHDEAFKKLVGGRTPMDSSDLKELARECQSPEAKAKLRELISQNKAGASFEKLGIDGPKAPPSMAAPSSGPSMSGPSMGSGGGRR